MRKLLCLMLVVVLIVGVSVWGRYDSAEATVITLGYSGAHYTHSNGGVTRIGAAWPASSDGTITSVTVENTGAVTSERIFIAYYTGSSNIWQIRSSYYVGSATSGWHTYSVSLAVKAGDCIGQYGEGATSLATGYTVSTYGRLYSGECSDVGDSANFAGSKWYYPVVYGSGTTGLSIGNVDAVANGSIVTLDGVSLSVITSVDGVQ